MFDKPTPPEPFGYKIGWLVIRSSDLTAVLQALPIRTESPASWRDGIAAAYDGRHDFIAPPISGHAGYQWICVVGNWAMGLGDRRSVGAIGELIARLSSKFGEAHAYATHRVIEYHHWMMARKGRLVRSFAYLGETGEVYADQGPLTDIEKTIRTAKKGSRPAAVGEWVPDESDAMAVAAEWSFDPTTLSPASGPAVLGRLARM